MPLRQNDKQLSQLQQQPNALNSSLASDILFKGKYKALKAENKKLKELLRSNEALLGNRITESKQD